jgi:glycosylphosphatidylinositol phospholipase D
MTMTCLSLRAVYTVLIAAAIALAVSCGEGGDKATPSPTPSVSVAPPSSSPASTSSVGGIDLATAKPMLTAYGAGSNDFPSDQPGLAMGDLNGDGIQDFVAGARFADPNGVQDAGAAYAVFGSSRPPATVDFGANQQDVTINGPAANAGLGLSASIGDLNGDGAEDLVVSAPFNSITGPPQGSVYILFGPFQHGTVIDLAHQAANVTINGQTANGFFGDSLAIADLNGDGMADLAIGSVFGAMDSPSAVPTGAVYIYFGRASWPAALAASDADSALYAPDDNDELGDFLSTGDVNGDGRTDLIATAEAADGPNNDKSIAAEVRILYGRPQFQKVYAPGEEDVVIYGAHENDTLGFSTAAGDLNGDGIDDLALSAHLQAGAGVERSGVVWVLYGRADLPKQIDTTSPPDYMAEIDGTSTGDLLATCVAITDVNSDGAKELVLGGSFVDVPGRGSDAGSIYVLNTAHLTGTTPVDGSALIERFNGAAAGESLGGNMTIGDFNGDGKPEIVAVSENAAGPTPDRPNAGRVYVLSP